VLYAYSVLQSGPSLSHNGIKPTTVYESACQDSGGLTYVVWWHWRPSVAHWHRTAAVGTMEGSQVHERFGSLHRSLTD